MAVRAAFWDRESLSAGRAKSPIPAITRAHFITGALVVGDAAVSVVQDHGRTGWGGLVRRDMATHEICGGEREDRANMDGRPAAGQHLHWRLVGYSPEVYGLEADGRIPHALEPALLLLCRGAVASGGALETASGRVGELVAEDGARGLLEDGPGGAEHGGRGRHGGIWAMTDSSCRNWRILRWRGREQETRGGEGRGEVSDGDSPSVA